MVIWIHGLGYRELTLVTSLSGKLNWLPLNVGRDCVHMRHVHHVSFGGTSSSQILLYCDKWSKCIIHPAEWRHQEWTQIASILYNLEHVFKWPCIYISINVLYNLYYLRTGLDLRSLDQLYMIDSRLTSSGRWWNRNYDFPCPLAGWTRSLFC